MEGFCCRTSKGQETETGEQKGIRRDGSTKMKAQAFRIGPQGLAGWEEGPSGSVMRRRAHRNLGQGENLIKGGELTLHLGIENEQECEKD